MPFRIVVGLGLWFVFGIAVSRLLDALLISETAIIDLRVDGDEGAITLSAIDLLAGLWILPAVLYLAARYIDRRRLRDFGLRIDRRWWGHLGVGFVLGGALMTAIFLFQVALGWVTIAGIFAMPGWSGSVPAWFVPAWFVMSVLSYLVGSVIEELLHRGLLLTNFAEGFQIGSIGPGKAVAIGILLTSGFFAFVHMTAPNATLISTASIGLAGVFLSLGYVLTGQLAFPIGVHVAWNFFEGNLYGFPISGSGATSVISIRQTGNDLLTGGAFGPEAGLLGIVAILLGIGATLAWVNHTRGVVGIHPALRSPELRD
jgi:membrane protease YdiL (CAAX protease family)